VSKIVFTTKKKMRGLKEDRFLVKNEIVKNVSLFKNLKRNKEFLNLF
jgi:hypothetical protein